MSRIKAMKTRIKTIVARLHEVKADCLIVTKPANVSYVTGFLGEDSWAFITAKSVYFLTDSRYTEQAQKQCQGCKIIRCNVPLPEAAAGLLKKLKSVRAPAVEQSTSMAQFQGLKKHLKGRLKTADNIIESVRSIKDNREIAAIKKAAQIATQAFKRARWFIKAGMTENELAGRLDFEIRKAGSASSFGTIVAFGPNTSVPHHQPGSRKLKKNDTVLIDFGVRFNGYCCDLTRSFAVGQLTLLYEKVYSAVQESHSAAIAMVKAGVEISKVDIAARKVIKSHNLAVYSHGTGHGLGLEVHEQPIVTRKTEGKLQAGMVLTIEPAVYIPGKLGLRLEDDILVTESGCKVLTGDCPHQALADKMKFLKVS